MADAEAAAALQAQITAAVVAALAAQAAAAAPVSHVAVKLPEFWVKGPKRLTQSSRRRLIHS